MACRLRQLSWLDAGRLRLLRAGFSGRHVSSAVSGHEECNRLDHDCHLGYATRGRNRFWLAC